MVTISLVPTVLVCLVCTSVVQSARILGMFPLFAKSHHRFYQSLMTTLARAGHDVVVYSPFPMSNPPPNYTNVYLKDIPTEGEKFTKIFSFAASLPNWKCNDPWLNVDNMYFEDFMGDERVQQLFKSDEKFDLVFSEAFAGVEFTVIMSHIFKAPMIAIQTFPTTVIVNYQFGNTIPLAFIPDLCAPLSDRLSFLERVHNAFSLLRSLYYVYYYKYLPSLQDLVRERFPVLPPLQDMLNNICLIFVNDHLTADYAQPRPPNIIPVGGLHIEPLKPLPQDIKKFMDEAPEGVILFSLGTYVQDELQPKEYFNMYINVFKRLRQRVLWKTRKEDIQGLPDNVMTRKWMPQPDILAHPNCVLFITHGGLNSQLEAIHYGVPVVGVPQFGDQFRNVKFYEARGVGVMVEVKDLSESTMSAAIWTVLNKPQYRENMKKLSQVFRDQPVTPAESVVYWTEYILRHGRDSQLTPSSTLLSWYQTFMLDVIAAILAAVLISTCFVYLIIRRIISLLCTSKIINIFQ